MTHRSYRWTLVALIAATVSLGWTSGLFATASGWSVRDSRGSSGLITEINVGSGGASDFGGDSAFPDGGGDNFSLSGYGFLKVDTAGDYTFAVSQDDQVFVTITNDPGNATQTIADTGCCNTQTYTLSLDKGVHFTNFVFREFGGAEYVELSSAPGTNVPFSTATFSLVNDAGNALMVANDPLEFRTNHIEGKGQQGFNVVRQNSGGSLSNIDQAEDLLFNTGGAAEFMDMPQTINYNQTVTAGPAANPMIGGDGSNYALLAEGYVDVLDPSGFQDLFLYVNSDDGFRLRINGAVVSEFAGPTGASNTLSPLVTLQDGDFLQLTFFEAGGGEHLRLARDLDGSLGTNHDRLLIGDPASGIVIYKTNDFGPAIPEPATLGLLGLGAVGLLGRRRRRIA